ncbi:hypothetical protein G7077_10230 [Sphingomonas piscis]|uniref:ABC-type uncharacterized transport system domain-containing protein n=1 Tax=Sphingomonas piscis TaxID=2714943 RepID=A0A6G7YR53_9SPHN|nr:hypothetical protein [Sphingomonas piscis]QIK79216.1 hypothetical protein G7077_10230 [Sphingomonas piscis]
MNFPPVRRTARIATALLVLLLLVGAAALIRAHRTEPSLPSRPAAERPTLLLLTSLPLVFGERMSLTEGGAPALTALETRYTVVPVSAADAATLGRAGLLLMAHARAQTAENLVALDKWVRSGGRLLLLADPALEWESQRPLGDPFRPSPMFTDTGLLAHWGLRLDAPAEKGPTSRKMAGREIETLSPGKLSGSCSISRDGFTADCALGQGRAVVVADADFLDAGRFEKGPANLDSLLAELATLESK